jgi:hypothetical protein
LEQHLAFFILILRLRLKIRKARFFGEARRCSLAYGREEKSSSFSLAYVRKGAVLLPP